MWEGLDGSQVLAHMPPADTYNAQAFPDEILRTANKNKDSNVFDGAIMLVGHGDGGGGASPAMLESMKRMRDLDGIPKVEFATPTKFFEQVKHKKEDLPRWVGELYFELHRGTYTSQARTKQSNRQCENNLRELELLGTMACLSGPRAGKSFPYPTSLLAECWKLVLKNAFHDTLPGSCIGDVYKETKRDYALVFEKCAPEVQRALAFISDAFTSDSTSHVPQETKRLKTNTTMKLSMGNNANGYTNILLHRASSWKSQNEVPLIFEVNQPPGQFRANVGVQASRMSALTCLPDIENMSEKQSLCSVIAAKSRPSGLGITLEPELLDAEEVKKIVPATVSVEEEAGQRYYVLANRFVKATISSTGLLTSLLLLDGSSNNREALGNRTTGDGAADDGGNRLVIYDDVSQFWCAWDTEIYSYEKKWFVGDAVECQVVDEGPLRASLHLTYPCTEAGTKIQQLVSLRAENARVDFRTDVDWKESRKMLRVVFNTQVRAPYASYNTQFGFVRRPTTFNHSWEIAKFEAVGHHYCDLSEHNFGVAVLNDCKYGYSVRDNKMRLSLLRASKSPDEDADMGMHHMTYSVLPHWGSFPNRAVIEEGADLNWPPVLRRERTSYGKQLFPAVDQIFEMVTIGPLRGLDTVIISAIKKPELDKEGIVVRMYEAMGARGHAQLSCPSGLKVSSVQECNMLEDPITPPKISFPVTVSTDESCVIGIPFTPFQIRTLILQVE